MLFSNLQTTPILIIPESISSTSQSELANIEQWSLNNNLKLNRNKSYEIIFHPPRSPIPLSRMPSEIPGVKRVSSLKCLGVVLSHNLSISEHISEILCSCQQSLYALKLLRAYGLNDFNLSLIFTAIVLSKITYASPAWRGLMNANDHVRLESFLRKAKKMQYITNNIQRLLKYLMI